MNGFFIVDSNINFDTKIFKKRLNKSKKYVKHTNLIGLGEPSHGDDIIQMMRLNILKELRKIYKTKKIIVAWEAEPKVMKIAASINKPNITFKEYQVAAVKDLPFSRETYITEPEYLEILYWCYNNKIDVIGVDQHRKGKKLLSDKERDVVIYDRLDNLATKHKKDGIIVFLAHNAHINSSHIQFPGIAIATHSRIVDTWIEERDWSSLKYYQRRVSVYLGPVTERYFKWVAVGVAVYTSKECTHNFHMIFTNSFS